MRLVKKGDIVRVVERRWGLAKNLITEVMDVYTRYDREVKAKIVWVTLKARTGNEFGCQATNVALASSKGMRFQYQMQGPFIDG